jgi:hypothetical protein
VPHRTAYSMRALIARLCLAHCTQVILIGTRSASGGDGVCVCVCVVRSQPLLAVIPCDSFIHLFRVRVLIEARGSAPTWS